MAIATVVERRGSAPRDPGASLALNDAGEIAGSVTGGCVEPSVMREAQEVLDGGEARVREYGIADDEAFEVGLACGGTVGILVAKLDRRSSPRSTRPSGRPARRAGDDRDARQLGEQRRTRRRRRPGRPAPRERRERPRRRRRRGGVRPRADAAARRCTSSARSTTRRRSRGSASCSATASRCATRARRSSRRNASRRRTSSSSMARPLPRPGAGRRADGICVLTHDEKFDVPALIAALETPAVYIGAMGSKVTTADREERLRAEGVDERASPGIHAPIGLAIGARRRGGRGRDRRPDRGGDGARTPPRDGRARCREPAVGAVAGERSYFEVSALHAGPGMTGNCAGERELDRPWRVTLSVAILPVPSITVFLPAILKSCLSLPLFVTWKSRPPRGSPSSRAGTSTRSACRR